MDLRLIVIWVALRNLLHRLRVGLRARKMTDFVMVHVNDGERIDVVAFALCLCADTLPLGDRRGAFGEILRGSWNMRIKQQA